VSLVVSTTLSGSAQTHPPNHQTRPHDSSSHEAVDPQQHAAMHGWLLGSWTGTVTMAGADRTMNLAAANDQQGQLTVTMSAAGLGAARDVRLKGDTIRWRQTVSGIVCEASATLDPAKPQAVPALSGRIACDQSEMSFALHKVTQ